MLNCSFFQQHCYIGVIVGTGKSLRSVEVSKILICFIFAGCNLCYMESLDKIPKLKGKINPEKGKEGVHNSLHQNKLSQIYRWPAG